MDQVHEFINIYERCWDARQGTELARLFKDGNKYFQDVPENKNALALARIFGITKGLLIFLTEEMEKPQPTKDFSSAILEAFHFLSFLIKKFADVCEEYLQTIKKSSIMAMILSTTNYHIKNAACAVLLAVIKNFTHIDLDIGLNIKEWMTKTRRGLYSTKELQFLLRIVGAVAHYHPQTPFVNQHSLSILQLMIKNFDQLYTSMSKEGLKVIILSLESITDMLHTYPLEDAALTKFYEKVKQISVRARLEKYAAVLQIILRLMTEQMDLLKSHILTDHQFWHEYFLQLREEEAFSEPATEALNVYYQVMGKLLTERPSDQMENVLNCLRAAFVKKLTDKCLERRSLALTVMGYSQIAEPIKKAFNDAAVEEMFYSIASRTLPLFFSEDEASDHFDDLAGYQEALSRILCHISNVSMDQIRILMKFCTLMIKRYPELSASSQQRALDSLKTTFTNVQSLKIHLTQEFMKGVIFEGIVWSCSHSLLIDAELKRDLENLPKRPITYKDYVGLWKGLVNTDKYGSITVAGSVINEIIETCINSTGKLNLSIKTRSDSESSDWALAQIAENESDFRIFLNLVDLYDEICEDIEPDFFNTVFPRLLQHIVSFSYKYVFLSGFYRLADRILSASCYFDNQDNAELYKMVLQYLQNTLNDVCQFPHELQVACVQLLLHAPKIFIPHLIDRIAPVFKIALNIGLSDYDLANTSLDSLETYISCVDNEKFQILMRELLPSLELFLRSRESPEMFNSLRRRRRKSMYITDESLASVQKRILVFFGRIDRTVIQEYLHEQSLITGASWDKKDLLSYSLNFPDLSLDIYLDKILPRIIDLAQNCSDRRTKVAACEVFHTIISIVLGNTVQYLSADADRFAGLYKILCPALLRLGCDADEVVMRLFNPLMLQITHWLSSKLMLHSPAVLHLVDALFDGLSDESSFALRDFSGICLAEFARWSIKQSSDRDLSRAPVNLNTIVENIANFALHPSHRRRVAAAIAFNYLHKILSSNEEVVNIFWLQLFYCFVKSMNQCNDSNISKALSHLKVGFFAHRRMFNRSDSRRRIPIELGNGTLEQMVNWLFCQCKVLDSSARKKTMELFRDFAVHVDVFGSDRMAVSNYLKNNGIRGVNGIILHNLNDTTTTISAEHLKILLRSIDCYIWLMKDQLIDDDLLFGVENLNANAIFSAIQNFITSVLNFNDEEKVFADFKNHTSINFLQCETILCVLDFSAEIAKVNNRHISIYERLFNANFFKLISRCVVNACNVGFDMKNLILTELLPAKLEKILNILTENLPPALIQIMIQEFESIVENALINVSLDEENMQENIYNLTELKGLKLLQKCNILTRLESGVKILANRLEKTEKIFHLFIFSEFDNFEIETKIFFENLLELFLNNETLFLNPIIQRFIINNTLVEHRHILDHQTRISEGELFFNNLKDVLIPYFLANMADFFDEITNLLQQHADAIFPVVEQMAMWLIQRKEKYQTIVEIFADMLITRFRQFDRALNNVEARKKSQVNIYRTVIRLKQNPLEISEQSGPLYLWIVKELSECRDLTKITQILNDFLICLVGENSDEALELKIIFRNLKIYRDDRDANTGNVRISPKAVECYQTMLALLPITRSTLLLQATINFAMGAGKFLNNEATILYINKYFICISPALAVKSLKEIYQLFIETVLTVERFDVLQNFLLPSLRCCNSAVITEFLDENIREIFSTIAADLPANAEDYKRLVVSKIGCYNLMEFLFLNLDIGEINRKYGKAASDILHRRHLDCQVSIEIFKRTFEIRKLNTDADEHKEILRLLHCAAFNCCVTIASVAKTEDFYRGLFGENRATGQLIWERIVDCKKRFNLSQTFKEFPKKRSNLVNIKKTIKNKQLMDSTIYSYIKTYNLASSTLNEDVFVYDFSEVKLQSASSKETMSVVLEADDLNEHECMAAVCGILNVMCEADQGAAQRNPQPPTALQSFARSLSSTEYNVQLFMLKIVLNNQLVFKPFAEFFLPPVMHIIDQMLTSKPMNYIITDTLLMLVDWAEVAIPKNSKNTAQKMFNSVVEKVDVGASTEYIVRYNFSIVELLVQVWHECLDIPEKFFENMANFEARSARLILIYLANKMAAQLVQRDDVLEFLIKYLETNWQIKEETVLQTCESIGLFLQAKFADHLDLLTLDGVFSARIRNVFDCVRTKNLDRLVKCINSMCKACPALSEKFIEYIMHSYSKVTPANKAKCLEVFLQRIPKMTVADILRDLKYLKLSDLLENKVTSCEKICLKIIESLVAILRPEDFFPLANLAAVYGRDDILELRQLTYKIFTNVFKKYSRDISDDYSSQLLVTMSKKILLPGLLDASPDLQQQMLMFWTEEIQLSDKCVERIQEIFDVYSPDVEKDFPSIFFIIFLHLTKKSPTYNRQLFQPLDNSCNFRNYEIAMSWRMKNLTYRIPLFATSYASQYSQRFTISSLASDDLLSSYDGLMLRATNISQLEQSLANETFLAEKPVNTLQENDVFRIPQLPSKNILSKRFLKNPKKSKSSATASISNYDRKQEAIKRRNTVQLNRSYKIGDFPDIALTHESILKPLLELIKLDQLICKDLMVSVICALLKEIQTEPAAKCDEFMGTFGEKMNQILKNRRGNGLIIPALLEIMFSIEDLKFDSKVVARVSRVTGFTCLGALLLENSLISERVAGPSTKRIRREAEPAPSFSTDQWIHIAELYQSTNESDVVLSIFQNHVNGHEDLRRACCARAASRWDVALDAYKDLYEVETGAIQRHCHQGMIECLARLSDWKQIVQNFDPTPPKNILEHAIDMANSEDDSWCALWYMQAWTYLILTDTTKNDRDAAFLQDLMVSIRIPSKSQTLMRLFAEEIAVLCPMEHDKHAYDAVNTALNNIREQWMQLSPLVTAMRLREVDKLRGICNIDIFRKVVEDPNNFSEVLLQYWQSNYPREQDDLLLWDRHMAYRTKFTDALCKTDLDESSQYAQNQTAIMRSFNTLQLQMIEAAFRQKNVMLIRCLWTLVDENTLKAHGLWNKLILNAARFRMLRAEVGTIADKLKYYPSAWKFAEGILHELDLDVDTQVRTRHFISELALSIVDIDQHREELFQEIIAKIKHFIKPYTRDCQNARECLKKCSFDQLKVACSDASHNLLDGVSIADCHLKLLKFCHQTLQSNDSTPIMIEHFVRSTLQAMYYGSREGSQYFPCLLTLDYLEGDEIQEIFIELTQRIPSWRFLKWHTQLLLHLSTSLKNVAAPIIQRLIKDYPNALVYTLRLILDLNPELMNRRIIAESAERLSAGPELQNFVTAMQYLVRPELYLDYHLKQLVDDRSTDVNTKVDVLMKKVYPPAGPVPMQGKLYRYIENYQDDVKRLRDIPAGQVEECVKQLRIELRKRVEKNDGKDSNELRDYSPWLSQFNGSNLEIPGQYTGDCQPLPEYHTKIMRFESRVGVMKSSRKPVKITIIGNDAKNYNFLVKFGEDLRVDERVQQALGIMNEILQSDGACAQRNLSINTYQVVGFSGSQGLIQWVDNTKTLQDYVQFTLTKEQKRSYLLAHDKYHNWIVSACPNAPLPVQYKEALKNYPAEVVAKKMDELIKELGSDVLRRTFLMLNPSLESFISSRKSFMCTYATMCIAQWILGIGDRHLENTLISVESGKCTGIDFASAFGGGVDQAVPELVPFRLTNQIRGLMKPFDEQDEFGTTMIHVLRALRNNRAPLLAYLNDVANENLNWKDHIRELSEAAQDGEKDVTWLPQEKIGIISRKLSGDKPSDITVEELRNQHYDPKYISRYIEVILGSECETLRFQMSDVDLTPEDQVKCLLDQATDLNVLGRMYSGWHPWI